MASLQRSRVPAGRRRPRARRAVLVGVVVIGATTLADSAPASAYCWSVGPNSRFCAPTFQSVYLGPKAVGASFYYSFGG